MAVTLVPRDDTLDLEITGRADQLWCLSSGVQIPWEDVVDVRVQSWEEVRAGLGWRVGGAYWPGWIATGWYTMPGGAKGDRQLLGVFRKRSELVVVETRRPRPRRLVVPSDHAAALVEEITRRMGGHIT